MLLTHLSSSERCVHKPNVCDTDEVYALSVADKNGGNLCFAQRKAEVFLYFERNIFTVHYKKTKAPLFL